MLYFLSEVVHAVCPQHALAAPDHRCRRAAADHLGQLCALHGTTNARQRTGGLPAQALWIINAYPLVMAGLLLGSGTLGDRVGHRRMFWSA